MKPKKTTLAIIGSGASTVFLLKHFLDNIDAFTTIVGEIAIFEKEEIMGVGMPYSPHTTDYYNMANITSEEIPELNESFAEWLKRQDDKILDGFGIQRADISEREIYSRLTLGIYLGAQYSALVAAIRTKGIQVEEFPKCEVTDVAYDAKNKIAHLHFQSRKPFVASMVVISTGHWWVNHDNVRSGYFCAPWPIARILPKKDEKFNFKIGILGASLSAFDVVSSLSRRHGEFKTTDDGGLTYLPDEGTDKFNLVMHDSNGWLPHLQYEQQEPMRKIYRHFTRDFLFGLIDKDGFLRLDDYFDNICKPALSKAFEKDEMPEMVQRFSEPDFGFLDFVECMSRKHEYENPFDGMRDEMQKAEKSVEKDKPIHWKEVTDDLMYALNFHAELMPAEDHIFFNKEVRSFLMNVIAAMPLQSANLLLALHDAGKLSLVKGRVEIPDEQKPGSTTIEVSNDEETETYNYRMFINCGGQKPVNYEDFPFEQLKKGGVIRAARIEFANADKAMQQDEIDQEKLIEENNRYFLKLDGIDINASYKIIDGNGAPNNFIHNIAFTHTTGLRPYSYGLQACSSTSQIFVEAWLKSLQKEGVDEGNIEDVSRIYEEETNL